MSTSADNATWSRHRTRVFQRKHVGPQNAQTPEGGADGSNDQEKGHGGHLFNHEGHRVNHNGHRVTKGIQPDGESGRRGVHPWKMAKICFRSSCTASKWTNILWPFPIAALILFYYGHDNYGERHPLWVFITAYIGMVPAANLVGFAGQELARKIPKVAGVLLETTFGSIVEIILFTVLVVQAVDRPENVTVIRAAILGSILANMLLCLGLCFFVGGIFHPQQTFHEAISEVGSNLMLVAGFALVIPSVYYNSLHDRLDGANSTTMNADYQATRISRAASIILLIAFAMYIFFQARSHHGLYEDILEADEERDHDRHRDLTKEKLTLTESIIALVIALTFVSFMAVFLVEEIEYMVNERGVPDAFLGLILIPVVEKAAEHITAVDEAYDNQMNFALSHVLGASIQTALLNTPLVIIVGWGLGVETMNLNFELFDSVVIILAIIVVGNFLRDEKSDYLEGALCVFVYVLIAVCAFFYPNPLHEGDNSSAETLPSNSTESEVGSGTTSSLAAAAATEAARRVMAML